MRDLLSEFKKVNDGIASINEDSNYSKEVLSESVDSKLKEVIKSAKKMGSLKDKQEILSEMDTLLVYLSYVLRDLKEPELMKQLRKCREKMDINVAELEANPEAMEEASPRKLKQLKKLANKNKKTKKPKKIDPEKMSELADATGLEHDGGDDSRLFAEMISVSLKDMDEDDYNRYEKDVNSVSIKGDGYEVYAWNDVSGYDYWKAESEESEYDGMNYIMVTAHITDADKVDAKKLKDDVEDAHGDMSGWDAFR